MFDEIVKVLKNEHAKMSNLHRADLEGSVSDLRAAIGVLEKVGPVIKKELYGGLGHDDVFDMWFWHNGCWQKIVEYIPLTPGRSIAVPDEKGERFNCFKPGIEGAYRFARDLTPYGKKYLSSIPRKDVPPEGDYNKNQFDI